MENNDRMRQAVIEYRIDNNNNKVRYLRSLRNNDAAHFFENTAFIFSIRENNLATEAINIATEIIKMFGANKKLTELPENLYLSTIDGFEKKEILIPLAPIINSLGYRLNCQAPDPLSHLDDIYVIIRAYEENGQEYLWASYEENVYFLTDDNKEITAFPVKIDTFELCLHNLINNIVTSSNAHYRFFDYHVLGLAGNAAIDHYGMIDALNLPKQTT